MGYGYWVYGSMGLLLRSVERDLFGLEVIMRDYKKLDVWKIARENNGSMLII